MKDYDQKIDFMKLADDIIELLIPEGYDSYAEYETAVNEAIRKLEIKGILIKTGLRNTIREHREFLKPMIKEIEQKQSFLKENQYRLNKYNRAMFEEVKDMGRKEMNISNHETLDKILESNFGEEELKVNKLIT